MKSSAADLRQVGGRHYKNEGEQHWTRQYRLFGPGYFIGCITKYVERYKSKNGLEDLEKAQHFLEKLIELETEAKAEVETEVRARRTESDEERQLKLDLRRDQLNYDAYHGTP